MSVSLRASRAELCQNGQQIGVELRGGLTASLKAQIDAITTAHPEILTWEGYTDHEH